MGDYWLMQLAGQTLVMMIGGRISGLLRSVGMEMGRLIKGSRLERSKDGRIAM